jgi:hypothetical protein
MEEIYKKALKVANSEFFSFKLNELGDQSFELEGEYFTLDFQPMVEGVQLHVHEKTDVLVDPMMEELAEMTIIREKLEPLLEKLR